MSVVIETFLICDGYMCGRNFGADDRNSTALRHRKHAKYNGWKYVNGKDYCWECVENMK